MHFVVEIETKNGTWQTITGLNTDYVVLVDDTTNVVMLEGEALIAAETNNDKINQRTISKDEAAYINTTGKISDVDINSFDKSWWKDDFYKIPLMAKITESISRLTNKMQLKALSIGYGIYVILIVLLLLVIIMFKSRRYKSLFWLFMIGISAFCAFILYYFASDMQISIFDQINNLSSRFKDSIIKIGAGIVLTLIVLSSLISTNTGKRRRRPIYNNNHDGYDYDDDGGGGDDGDD